MSHVVATSDSRSVRGDDAAPDGAGEVFLVPFLPTAFAVGHIMPPAKAGFGAPLAAKLTPMGQRPRKSRPEEGRTLKGSNPDEAAPVLHPAARGSATPSGSKAK